MWSSLSVEFVDVEGTELFTLGQAQLPILDIQLIKHLNGFTRLCPSSLLWQQIRRLRPLLSFVRRR